MLKYRIGLMAVLAFAGIHAAPVFAQRGCACDGVTDCNCNGVDDACDVSCSNSGFYCVGEVPANAMCNSGFHPSCGTSLDCDSNGIPDECQFFQSDWNHPCAADPGMSLVCVPQEDAPPLECRCEADFETAANWTGGAPNTCTDEVQIVHSNAAVGFCDGGSSPGSICIATVDCSGGGTCILEEWMEVDLTTADTNPRLVIKADITAGVTDSLVIIFTGATATFGEIELDGANGPITFSGEVKTN